MPTNPIGQALAVCLAAKNKNGVTGEEELFNSIYRHARAGKLAYVRMIEKAVNGITKGGFSERLAAFMSRATRILRFSISVLRQANQGRMAFGQMVERNIRAHESHQPVTTTETQKPTATNRSRIYSKKNRIGEVALA